MPFLDAMTVDVDLKWSLTTLKLECELDILKIYLQTKNEVAK